MQIKLGSCSLNSVLYRQSKYLTLYLNKVYRMIDIIIGIKVHLPSYLDNSHFNLRLGSSISVNIEQEICIKLLYK